MDNIKISFKKDEELVEDIKRVKDIWSIYGIISIEFDGKKIPNLESLGVFISYFFFTCLSLLPKLHSGHSGKFELEGPFELGFESINYDIYMYLDEGEKVMGEKLKIELKSFAHEVIKATEEFISYALKLKPELRKDKSNRELQDEVNNAKIWYCETYGEKI